MPWLQYWRPFGKNRTAISSTANSSSINIDGIISIYHFWEEYGSHPLWWEVGDPKGFKDRKKQTQAFAVLMQKVFLKNSQHISVVQDFAQPQLLESIVKQICTLDKLGRLLGMLQCNVMEFEFLSPVEQYIDHIEQQCGDEQQNDNDSMMQTTKQWLENHQSNDNLLWKSCTVGSGLYPLLTLANHDCDPNASVDFLSESNRGSMVALRDIRPGEEICITYVPNGDLDAGGTPERFRQHQPSRTWKFLNSRDESNDGEEKWDETDNGVDFCHECGDEEESEGNADELEEDEGQLSPQGSETNETLDDCAEGYSPEDRAKTLLEYGFACRCRRCLHERSDAATSYKRDCDR